MPEKENKLNLFSFNRGEEKKEQKGDVTISSKEEKNKKCNVF